MFANLTLHPIYTKNSSDIMYRIYSISTNKRNTIDITHLDNVNIIY